ncbi:hypothetical protein GCM10009087_11310 [Sphingomonas oligophenolica]|uniref:Flagellar hook-length control protein FliK n=1 Tax=Sphingomonas oligophenolica TaxID=301154 RepID=A0ABU9Y402_9SPHN
MTVVLSSYPGLPAPPPAATPVAPPLDSEPGGALDFGYLLRGLIYPCAGAPGFLEGAAPGDKPNASSPALAADIFNQDGFFMGAVPAGEQSQADRQIASEASAPGGQTPLGDIVPPEGSETPDYGLQSAVKSGAPAPSSPADVPVISLEVLASAWTTASLGAGDVQSALPDMRGANQKLSGEIAPIHIGTTRNIVSAATEVIARNGPDRGNESASAIRTTSSRARFEALLPRLFAQDGAALNTRVSVQAVEHGLQVVAKLDDLGREERVRLRHRIAATLSRHGLVGREIMLNGDKDMASTEGNH